MLKSTSNDFGETDDPEIKTVAAKNILKYFYYDMVNKQNL